MSVRTQPGWMAMQQNFSGASSLARDLLNWLSRGLGGAVAVGRAAGVLGDRGEDAGDLHDGPGAPGTERGKRRALTTSIGARALIMKTLRVSSGSSTERVLLVLLTPALLTKDVDLFVGERFAERGDGAVVGDIDA